MDPYRAEYRRDIVGLANTLQNNGDVLMSRALGTKISRNVARIVNSAPVQFAARHKGKIALGAGAGAVLW